MARRSLRTAQWLLALALAGCRPAREADEGAGASCLRRLAAEDEPAPKPKPAPPAPLSRVVVDVGAATDVLRDELERVVPVRLADARDVPFGAAGRLRYSLDRRPFVVAVEGDDLGVSVGLGGSAELCKPVGPLGCVAYAGCTPAARMRASLPLLLTPDYAASPVRVTVAMTRRCTLTALDLDVTPLIQARADEQAALLERRINASLPSFNGDVAFLWRSLASSLPLGRDACVRGRPTAVVEAPPLEREGVVSIALGVEGELTIVSPCSPPRAPPPLPAPRVERGLSPGVALAAAFVVTWPEASSQLARSLAPGDPLVAGVPHITDARLGPDEDPALVRVTLTLAGEVCGESHWRARPVLDATSRAFALADLRPTLSTRIALVSAGLNLPALSASVVRSARVGLPADATSLVRDINALGRGLDTTLGPSARVVRTSVEIEAPTLGEVSAQGEGLRAVVRARGAVKVRVKLRARGMHDAVARGPRRPANREQRRGQLRLARSDRGSRAGARERRGVRRRPARRDGVRRVGGRYLDPRALGFAEGRGVVAQGDHREW